MANYTYKKRKDGGFDLLKDGQAISPDQWYKESGKDRLGTASNFALQGDKVSQQFVKNNARNTVDPVRDITNFGRTIVAGVQQGAGSLADIAAQGGALVQRAGIESNPLISQDRKNQELRNFDTNLSKGRNTEAIRKLIQNQTDATGQKIVGTSDVDQNAQRIANGQGDARDIAAVAGKAAQAGLDATMFFNPASLATGAAKNSARNVITTAAKDAALQGGGQAVATGAQVYGQTGDLQKAAQQGAQAGLLSGVTVAGADLLAPAFNAVRKGTTNTVNNARPSVIASQDPRVTGFDDQYSQLAQRFDTTADPVARREISKAMAQNRIQRSSAQRSVQKQVAQGGYIRTSSEGNLTPEIPNQRVVTDISPTVPNVRVQGKQTRFGSVTAPQSGKLSTELAERVRKSAPEYDPTTNNKTLDSSIDFIKNNDFDGATNDVFTRLNQPNIDRQTVADSLAVATAHDLKGDEASLRIASDIYDRLSEKLTKAGQTVQAATLLNRRTPQGLLFDAQRQLNNAGIEVTPDVRAQIKAIADRTGTLKGADKDLAIAELQKNVNKLIPDELIDKIVGTWKAGLLTGVRTTTGGALSNALFRVLREASRPGAVALDMASSLFTGKRSTALTTRGAWDGTKEGLQKAGKYLKTGLDERGFTADGKYIDREINFNNKALNTYVNGVFRVMGAADRPFYYSQFKNSLAEAAIVEAKNAKLKGSAFDDYVTNAIEKPTDDALQYATNIAEQSVLGNNTFLSEVANKLRSAAEKPQNKVARFVTKGAIGVLAPFTKVPSAFLSRVIDFTPIGAVKEAVAQMANKTLNQQKLVQAISEAGTGTGLIYLGAELANNDMLTGNYPNDPTEQARWRTEGITPNSIKIGDKYYSLNYAGPIGALFGVGKSVNDSLREGNTAYDSILSGATQLATGTLEQSFLSGISGALDAVQDPERYAKNFVQSQAGSVIPTLLNDIGNATDSVQRQASNPLEAIQTRIPGARTSLNERTDVFGQTIEQANQDVPGRIYDPLRPSQSRSTEITDELDRLKSAGQSIFPTLDKTIKANGETIKLTPDQQKKYNDSIGQDLRLVWGNLLNSEEYKGLSDEDKKDALAKSQQDIQAVAKKNFLTELGRNDLADKIKLTDRQNRFESGTVSADLWAKPGSNSTATKNTNLKPNSIEYAYLDTVPSNTVDKEAWRSQEVTGDYRVLVDALNNNVPEGLPKLPYTNSVAELYADFAKRQADNKWSSLQTDKETRSLFQKAYKEKLSDNEKFLSSLPDNEFLNAVENGNISEQELNNILASDNAVVKLGGSAAIGNTLRKKLGLPTLASSTKKKSGSSRKKVGFKAPAGKGFSRVSSTTALRKLISGAGSGIKAKTVKG